MNSLGWSEPEQVLPSVLIALKRATRQQQPLDPCLFCSLFMSLLFIVLLNKLLNRLVGYHFELSEVHW